MDVRDQISWPRRPRCNRGGYTQSHQRDCSGIIVEPDDHCHARSSVSRSNQGGYIQSHQRECSRIIVEPNDQGCSYGSWFQRQEDNTEYSRTFHINHAMTWVRTKKARPSDNALGDYFEEDEHLDQPLSGSDFPQGRGYPNGPSYSSYHEAEDVFVDQPFSESIFPERSRCSYSPSYDRTAEVVVPDPPYARSSYRQQRRFPENSPSYSSFQRVKNYDEARHPRSFKRKHHEYHAERWMDTKEHDWHDLDSSPNMRSRHTYKKSFKKPMTNSEEFGGQPKRQGRHARSIKSEVSPYRSKEIAPAPVLNSAKVLEAECSKDNEGVDSGSKPATKSSKYKAEATLTKRLESKPSKDEAEANLKKKLATKSSEDNADANLKVKLESKSSNDNGEANLKKKPATKSSLDNAELNLKKKLATKSSKDFPEANHKKELATKSSKDDEEVNLTKKLATKSSQVNAEAKHQKELATKSFRDDKEANLTKKLAVKSSHVNDKKEFATKLFKDEEEANLAKKLATNSSQVNAEANLTNKLETKSTKSSHNEVECKIQDHGVLHGSSSDHNDSRMMTMNAKFSSKKDASSGCIRLVKDKKLICFAKCANPPIQLPSSWKLDIVKMSTVEGLHDLPHFFLYPSFVASSDKSESVQKIDWTTFLTFLSKYNKVATVEFENLKIHIFPPPVHESSKTANGLYFSRAVVAYELQELCDTSVVQRHATSAEHEAAMKAVSSLPITMSVHDDEVKNIPGLPFIPPDSSMKHVAYESDAYVKGSSSAEKGTCTSITKCHEAKEDVLTERNFVRADPSYLKTLGQVHSGWIFGAVAELADNSRDARASRLEISIETIFDRTVGYEIPMLSIIDDGVGMNHQEILRMIAFGHKVPDDDNQDCIGRFGVGFKTGSMRLGKDALVLTQTTHSRSVAFLSQSLNEGKDNVEIPVVSYRRQSQFMEIDTSVQSEALANYNLSAMKEFSPFNEYLIGEKAALFGANTGTQIYIWNMDKWGSDYTLEWQAGMRGGSSFHQGDIFIRSRRVRTRPGQTSRKVYIDYSLRCYLEVIFLEPRMKIYVQGSLVKSRPLAKTLNNTAVINEEVMGKQVQLTLGRCQIEWDEANSGMFLYWHGRLIEGYKRVGGMIHSADVGRGVIGVIDVTELMNDVNGGVWVHNNKQGFLDCEPYAILEEWLGKKADEYWDTFFDAVQLKKGKVRYKPDNEWVQCDKCRKWRLLHASFDSKNLPKDWFCFMEPFKGRCEMPEQKPGRGVITVGLKRSSGHDPSIAAPCEGVEMDSKSPIAEGKGEDEEEEEDEETPIFKRRKRGKSLDESTQATQPEDKEIPLMKRGRRGVQTARKYIQDS